MNGQNPNKILVCAAHPDDTEIGCGGSLTRYMEEGAEVFSLIFSSVNPSINPPEVLRHECRDAMSRLEIDRYLLLDFPMRELGVHRQNILQAMMDHRDVFNPDMVFIPSPNDLHNDHYTVAREGMRAFKGVTTFGYELPWNNITFHTQAFVKLNHTHIEKKLYALEAYESQKEKIYFDRQFMYCLARTRGVQIGCELAESFEVIRWVK